MRIPILQMFRPSPFEGLIHHAERLRESGNLYRQAMECYFKEEYEKFEELHDKVTEIESDADRIKRNIRGHLPRSMLMPVDKYQFLMYLRQQDAVLDAVEESLHWLSYRTTLIPEQIKKGLLRIVDKAVESMESFVPMVQKARSYFRSFSERERNEIKAMIVGLRHKEYESDQIERTMKREIFAALLEPEVTFHLIRLVEIMGSINDHAENAGDMMRAMIAK